VEIVDLLRREPVDVDLNVIVNLLANKRVLVTGAGGSIGSELCLQIANCGPARLVILGHGENSLYGLKNYLEKIGFRPPNLDFILADIRHPDRIESIYTRFEPEIIFHAAAHKHIPLMEENIEEAVTNNILGTWNLLQASKNHHVEKFIFISSSKAVKPISVMGMSKRAAEMLVQATAAETNLAYICIRLGNVLGTHGSVVPLFQRQIETGGPVTVTHPEMVRYFLTVREAVNLVLQSSVMGRNGEIFVLDLGDPIRIVDLARDMIELAGYRAGKDIEIVYTGLRPGERLDEHLYADDEIHSPSDHEKIFLAQNGSSLAFVDFQHEMDALQQLANAGETEKLRKRLIQLTGSPALKS
jgi:FlaA1/EpsC-like NDP-sugar epimerase